ncbi:transport system periplasmic binding protein [Salmonella enterica subsp. enterica serovar Madelia]|nr:transport system periplasmic binding protein [Salmonella enterica subsp. enterica serovar Madelia]
MPRYAADYSWVEISINPRARFHDGTPITARDVAFTFHKFMTEGVPQFRLVYKGTTVKAIAPLTVRIELAKPGKEDMLSLFSLPIMPEKFLEKSQTQRSAFNAALSQRAIPDYSVENGPVHCLFTRQKLLGG